MKELNDKREKERLNEIRLCSLQIEMSKKKRERWEFSDLSEQMAFDKNLEDLLIISDSFFEWGKNAKGDKKKVLDDLFIGTVRVGTYIQHLEVIVKKAICEYRDEVKRNTELSSQKRLLDLKLIQLEKEKNNEIKTLKAENEFLSRSQ